MKKKKKKKKKKKMALYIWQRIFTGRIWTEQIFHIFQIQCMPFFDTKGNCVLNLIFCDP